MLRGWRSARSRRAWTVRLAAWVCAAALAEPIPDAWASAWNAPAGEGLVIVDYSFSGGGRYFNGSGRLAPARSYSKGELAGYVEYGATDGLMLVARPSFDDIHIGAPDAGHREGLGSSAAGAQLHLLAFGPAVLAVQGTFSLPGTTSHRDPAAIGNTAREGDLRVLAGVDVPFGPFPAFIDAEGSYRIRSGGAAAQWHGDLTFGMRPLPRWLFLLQSFTTLPTGPGNAALPSSRSSKVALTGVYALTPTWSIQFGVFGTVYGREALRERGFTTGVWWYF